MEARPSQIMEFFNGTKQLLVPLFQRPYEWKKENWQTLWDDILERYERSSEDLTTHFTGAIVTAPARSVPVGVSKHLVIDGQQRLTTVAILICALRSFAEPDTPKYRKLTRLLINEDDEGSDHYKLLPTQLDRGSFFQLVAGSPDPSSRMCEAYEFFRARLTGKDSEGKLIDVDAFTDTLQSQITVVSIHLSDTDDPYLIFESLNAKGAPLNQADLIRNYLLLRLHSQAQQDAYERLWLPLQQVLSTENLTEFMRTYLMSSGEEVAKSEIYGALKRRLSTLPDEAVLEELERMHSAASLYARLVGLLPDEDEHLNRGLHNLRRLEMSVANPLLLRLLIARERGLASSDTLRTAVSVLESFVVRRMVCGVPTNQMKRIFLALIRELDKSNVDPSSQIVANLAGGMAGRRWPKDDEFLENWLSYRAYGSPLDRCRLLLETLERGLNHKEPASFDNATIEHVMPRTLTSAWRESLGPKADEVHERLLDSIGNLTLTGYNSELSNQAFLTKREMLKDSHFCLNEYIARQEEWDESSIIERGKVLFEMARRLWARPDSANAG